MPTTLITWYFYGMAGLGGWALFLIVALGAMFYIWYDSLKRNLTVWGWRIGILILVGFILPSMLYRFTVTLAQFILYIGCITTGRPPDVCVNTLGSPPLAPYYEIIFYLGLLGGLLSIAIAVAYYINFQGVKGSSRQPKPWAPPVDMRPPVVIQPPVETPSVVPPPVMKKKVSAWLVSQDGHSYQLCVSETTIGRSIDNDICLSGDTTMSKEHAKIQEQNNHFRLIDLGSTNGTRVNGNWLRQPVMLQPNDEVQFGDHTVLRFVTTGS